MQDEEAEASPAGSERDSDMEFEQMLADAEEMPPEPSGKASEEPASEAPADPPVRKKAKTKIGNKLKKKKKARAASKFPDGEVISSMKPIFSKHITINFFSHRPIIRTIAKCANKAVK